ncbi:hypothetical protein LB506_010465, partial [Fusarium annulatum]
MVRSPSLSQSLLRLLRSTQITEATTTRNTEIMALTSVKLRLRLSLLPRSPLRLLRNIPAMDLTTTRSTALTALTSAPRSSSVLSS